MDVGPKAAPNGRVLLNVESCSSISGRDPRTALYVPDFLGFVFLLRDFPKLPVLSYMEGHKHYTYDDTIFVLEVLSS